MDEDAMVLCEPEPEVYDQRRWKRIETVGEGYSPRTGHTAVSYGSSLYVFGGTDRRRRQQDLFQYNIDSAAWSIVEVSGPLPPRRSGALGIVHGSNMFIFGGYNGRDGNYFNDLYFFNFESRCWNEMSNRSNERPEARTDHIMVLHNSNIYVFGGYDGHTRFNNTYRYQLQEKCWELIEPNGILPSRRFGHSGAVHESSNRMIVFGGWDGRDTLDDLHEFDFITNEWNEIETTGPSPPHRYRHTSIIFDNNMFVFGGVDKGHSRFNDLQKLDLENNVWTEICTTGYIPSSRTFHRAVVVSNRMFLLGGYDGTDRLHDLYSIHVGPLSPPSLLTICANYTRDNVKEIVKHSSFKGVPSDLMSRVIWRHDTNKRLRGRCKICRHGRCSFYELSRLKYGQEKSILRNVTNKPKSFDHKKKESPCICGHIGSEHEAINEKELCKSRKFLPANY